MDGWLPGTTKLVGMCSSHRPCPPAHAPAFQRSTNSRRVPPPRPFDIAEKYGKDTFLAIHYLGSDWMPELFALKGRLDALAGRFRVLPRDLSDKIMQTITAFSRNICLNE